MYICFISLSLRSSSMWLWFFGESWARTHTNIYIHRRHGIFLLSFGNVRGLYCVCVEPKIDSACYGSWMIVFWVRAHGSQPTSHWHADTHSLARILSCVAYIFGYINIYEYEYEHLFLGSPMFLCAQHGK